MGGQAIFGYVIILGLVVLVGVGVAFGSVLLADWTLGKSVGPENIRRYRRS